MSYDVNDSLPENMQAGPNYLTTGQGGQVSNSPSEPLGFHGADPVVQRSGSAQAAVATTGATNSSPYGFTTAAQANAIVTLVNELRATLVEVGLIKGSA